MRKEKDIIIQSSIKVIEIDVKFADVEIETVDTEDSINMVNSILKCEENITVEEKENRLVIKETQTGLKGIFKNAKNVIKCNNHSTAIINGEVIVNGVKVSSSNNFVSSNTSKIKLILNKCDNFKISIKSLNSDIRIKDLTTDLLSVDITNGNVEITNSSIGMVKTITVHGGIDLNDNKFNDSYIETVHGDININQFKANKSRIKTVHGDICLNDGNIDDCNLTTNFGDIDFNNFNATKIDAHTTAGDIALNNIDILSSQLFSINGDIKVEILNSLLNYKTILESTSQVTKETIETEQPIISDEKNSLEVKTFGDIKVLFKGRKN